MATNAQPSELAPGSNTLPGTKLAEPSADLAVGAQSPSVLRRKGLGKVAPVAGVKRSASTSDVRSLAEIEGTSMSVSEKRRNKLGYHRTSIACSHCRRRKIRCLLDEKDPHGRCANCIRLKKECNFYPVDQQPPTDRRPRSASKPDPPTHDGGLGTMGSPGRTVGGIDTGDKYAQRQQLITPISENNWGAQFGPVSASPVGHAPFIARNYSDFSKSVDRQSPWGSPTYMSHSPVPHSSSKSRHEDSPNYWGLDDSAAHHGYVHAQYSVPPTSVSNTQYSQALPNTYTVSSGPEDAIWTPTNPQLSTVRSMSMVGPEELPSHAHQYQYSNLLNSQLKRRATNSSEVQSVPSLQNSAASSTASTTDSHAPQSLAAFQTPALTSQPGSYSTYQNWSAYPDPSHISGHSSADYSGWYLDTAHSLGQGPNVQISETQLQYSQPG